MGNQENGKPGHYQVWIIGWTSAGVESIGNRFRRYHLWKWPRCHRFDWSILVAKLETIIGWKVHPRSIQINPRHRACHWRHKLLLYWWLYNEVFGPSLLRLYQLNFNIFLQLATNSWFQQFIFDHARRFCSIFQIALRRERNLIHFIL